MGLVTTRLQQCIARYRHEVAELDAVAAALPDASPGATIELYERCYPWLEQALWRDGADFDALLADYQALFREQEALIQQQGDERCHFILSIPVADRPAHLKQCLESVHRLCQAYGYGGFQDGFYSRIRIIVAEDSREPENVQRHRELIDDYRAKGLRVEHFGLPEQYELLQALPMELRERLGGLLTDLPQERFYRKGQAANRNLSYLKFLQLTGEREKTLYYLVDSDQSFCVNRRTAGGDQVVYALNYFKTVDRVFRHSDTLMLTGKLVGDPPVSPSVMAANFLEDVTGFFAALAQIPPEAACRFHDLSGPVAGDAAYHDMANLFGFSQPVDSFAYRCRLSNSHDHRACLQDLCRRLSAFFFGEHLTRKTYYQYRHDKDALTPARTVYPGNYIVNYAGLKYIIPFGDLRLRMSGPTAGRLIAAEIGERFASINLPHLHRRTSGSGLDEDFRPGVELAQTSASTAIDLSDEFERQFFGDLMLFSTEALVTKADVARPFPEAVVREAIEGKEAELLTLYEQKKRAIGDNADRLESLVFHQDGWWLAQPQLAESLDQVRSFLANIRRNFGEQSPAWRQIQSPAHRAARKRQIVEALVNYRDSRDAWDSLFS